MAEQLGMGQISRGTIDVPQFTADSPRATQLSGSSGSAVMAALNKASACFH